MNQFQKIFHAVRFIGLANSLNSIQYAIQKESAEKSGTAEQFSGQEFSSPGPFETLQIDQNPLRLKFKQYQLEILLFGRSAYRITWLPASLPVPYAIAQPPAPIDQYSVDLKTDYVSITAPKSRLDIDFQGKLKFFNAANQLVRLELPPKFYASGWQHQAELHPHEALFGLGLRAAELNLRGRKFTAWNKDPGGVYDPGDDPLYFCIPSYLGASPAGTYLIFYENYHRGEFDFSNHANVSFVDGALRYYLFTGSPAEVLADYLELTGRPKLPPRWALGYHQSRWGYKTESDIRDLVENFRLHRLRLDAIHLDIDYMDGYRVFTVDPARFPDLPRLSRDLAEQDIRLVVILDPGVKIDPDYRIYAEGKSDSLYLVDPSGAPVRAPVWPGWCVFPDFSKPRTRDWWGKQYASLVQAGIAGYWHDMNEPATFPAWGDPTLPTSTIHNMDGNPANHLAGHNIFGLLMNKAGFEALKKLNPGHRPWILSRSGWAGNQRYAWNWTGDVNSSWEALQQLVATQLNMTQSGQYYSGSDIGGFSAHPEPELYLRWFQLSALSPFFRLHSATGLPPREPWHFDKPVLDIIRNTLELRRQLMHYLYTLAYAASTQGSPLIRPLFWEQPDNADLYSINDQFFLGEHLLIAPILQPGMVTRTVMLPAGEWIDFWTSKRYLGPGPINVLASFSHIPIFVRAGAVLPIDDLDKLSLRIYLPSNAPDSFSIHSQLYLDAGDGYGPSRLDIFTLLYENQEFQLSWDTQGEFQWPYPEIEVEIFSGILREIRVDSQTIGIANNRVRLSKFKTIQISPD